MKLKPCPFCGGEARKLCDLIDEIYFVMCLECRTESQTYDSLEEAIEAWNRREPIDKVVEQLEEKATEADEGFSIYEDNYIGGEGNAFREAIEIVKSGGAE